MVQRVSDVLLIGAMSMVSLTRTLGVLSQSQRFEVLVCIRTIPLSSNLFCQVLDVIFLQQNSNRTHQVGHEIT